MAASGAFTFVLQGHSPYVRSTDFHGELWLHAAIAETYLPLLQTLYDLRDAGIAYRLTLVLTPLLVEQLTDPTMQTHFDQYLADRIAAAHDDSVHYSEPATTDGHLRYLAEWYRALYESIQQDWRDRFNRDLIGAFRTLQNEGYIEIAASAATHSYLPLLTTPGAISGQIRAGIHSYAATFGRRPTSFWLPGCGYRPGLEAALAASGIRVFFAETHAITGGLPVGVAAGDVIGPYGDIKRHYVLPPVAVDPERDATTYRAYQVGDGIAAIGRNNRSGQQVWNVEWGYPGDFDYREYNRRAGSSGLRYWRVTDANDDITFKDYYHPDWAAYKIDQHAEHFAHLIGDLIRNYHNQTGEHGLVAAQYPADLFGYRWFEGVTWLGKVLQHLANNGDVDLTTATAFIDEHPPEYALALPTSSWGVGGHHFTWKNGETRWLWRVLAQADERTQQLLAATAQPSADERLVLHQALRELLLLQSGDWPFLITSGQGREFAVERFQQHLLRWQTLIESLEAGQPATEQAAAYGALDPVFADIDERWFRTSP